MRIGQEVQTMLQGEVMEREVNCTCFISAPCSFCESLDEEEGDAFWSGGKEGLRKLWKQRQEAEDDERGPQ